MHSLKKYFTFDDLLLVGALLITLGLAWNTVTAMQRNYRLQQKYNQLQAEVSLIELENQNLRYKIAYLKTDDYLELAAREKFNKAIPGEAMVYLPGSGSAQKAPVAKSTVAPAKPQPKGWQANFASWMRFIQGKNALNKI
ncbi:MAG TPA: septum formation initiator family protein [Candidatus Saccharibacteria bacterium]|jgi:cell division protein FtsB|nr:hypothetical protein [Patescibacteria group bacterium]HMS31280.1 septum formation initiator family protein [Candidatus Saccharibacteria bacterium]